MRQRNHERQERHRRPRPVERRPAADEEKDAERARQQRNLVEILVMVVRPGQPPGDTGGDQTETKIMTVKCFSYDSFPPQPEHIRGEKGNQVAVRVLWIEP